jgi:hypothetical protein
MFTSRHSISHDRRSPRHPHGTEAGQLNTNEERNRSALLVIRLHIVRAASAHRARLNAVSAPGSNTTHAGVAAYTKPGLLPPETNARAPFPCVFRGLLIRASVPFCALTGLVIPLHIVQLAWSVLEDAGATEREVKLARWVLLSTLKQSGDD